ncbi:MAG: sirohydrochlorin cobaltochelatase [Anaerovoracaceae bacterium]
MSLKKAILAVSFGTSHEETRKKTIEAIENQIKECFPEYEVRRAFTSGMIMNVLKKRDNMHIDNVEEAMEKLADEGFEEVVLQPTHIINGDEYDKMVFQAENFRSRFKSVSIGKPLLTESSDYEEVCTGIMKHFADMKKEEALLLMGHGTGHFADAAYAALDYRFKALGYENVFVGTVEGYPEFEDAMKQLRKYGPEKVTLLPMMVVAGDHAVNDMAGDEEGSWKSMLEGEGYQVECILKGLGEFPEIRNIYIKHAEKAMDK